MEWTIAQPDGMATICHSKMANLRALETREGHGRMTPSLHVHPAFRFDLESIIHTPAGMATIPFPLQGNKGPIVQSEGTQVRV
jgi:hypothetical protein